MPITPWSMLLGGIGMCEIEFSCTIAGGKKETLTVESSSRSIGFAYFSIEKIDLSPIEEFENLEAVSLYSNQLTELILKPLKGCTSLKALRASMNYLQKIDLSPLSQCVNLQTLDLGANRLQEVSLEPLKNLTALRRFRFDNNKISSIDLRHISASQNLRFIDLSTNRLNTIDLWPLAACTQLDKLHLYGNNITQVDVTPLLLLGDPARIYVDEGTEITTYPGFEGYIETDDENSVSRHRWMASTSSGQGQIDNFGWNRILELIPEIRSRIADNGDLLIQLLLLKALNVQELGLYDGPLDNILDYIPKDADLRTAREKVYDRMVTLVENQLIQNGLTLFIDVDSLTTTRASKLIPLVLEKRRREIEKIVLPVKDNRVDLKPLWLTSYGFAILRGLGVFDLDISRSGFDKIRKAFKEAGLKIRTTQKNKNSKGGLPLVSESMRSHILGLADSNRSQRIVLSRAGAIDLHPIVPVSAA